MRIYKGIVCEINKKYMIFMTSDGEFLRGIPLNSNPQIGDEVKFQLNTIPFPEKKRVKTYIIGPVLVAAILLIFFGTSLFTNTNSAYAYVKLGEELELSVDEQGNVIAVNNLKDSNNLSFDELEGLPIETALSKAIIKIAPNNQDIIISTKYTNEKRSISKEKIENAIDQVQNTKNIKPKNTDTNTNSQNNNVNGNQSQKNKVENRDTKESKQSDHPNNKQNNPPLNHNQPSMNSNDGNKNNGNDSTKDDKQQQHENPSASSQKNNNGKEQSNMKNGSNNTNNNNSINTGIDKSLKNNN